MISDLVINYLNMTKHFLILILFISIETVAQDKSKVKVIGTLGVTYEGYGLNVKPTGSNFYTARKPWNQVRFNFAPTMQFGKNFSVPT
jgi:hypothetical protein